MSQEQATLPDSLEPPTIVQTGEIEKFQNISVNEDVVVKDSAHIMKYSSPNRTTGSTGSSTNGILEDHLNIYTETDMMKFRHSFLRVLEELKMRREINDDNEKKIKELVELKHKLEQDLQEEQQKCQILQKDLVQQEVDIKQQFNEQLRQLEEDKRKLSMAGEGKEKEFKALKDEIRSLHMTKYTLEKKLKEQEHTLHVQNTSHVNCIGQLSQLELQCSSLFTQSSEITEQLERLDGNFKEAVSLNKKLQYVNSHQQCLLDESRKELNKRCKELTEAKVLLDNHQHDKEAFIDGCSKCRNTEQELRIQLEVVDRLQDQLTGLREEHCSVLQSLKDAHQLIERHVETANKATNQEAMLESDVQKLQEELAEVKQQFLIKQEHSDTEKQENRKNNQYLQDSVSDLSTRLKTLQSDYNSIQSSHERSEEKVIQLARDKTTLEGYVHEVQTEKSVYEKMLQQSKEEMKNMECRLKVNTTQLQQALEKSESELEATTILLKEGIQNGTKTINSQIGSSQTDHNTDDVSASIEHNNFPDSSGLGGSSDMQCSDNLPTNDEVLSAGSVIKRTLDVNDEVIGENIKPNKRSKVVNAESFSSEMTVNINCPEMDVEKGSDTSFTLSKSDAEDISDNAKSDPQTQVMSLTSDVSRGLINESSQLPNVQSHTDNSSNPKNTKTDDNILAELTPCSQSCTDTVCTEQMDTAEPLKQELQPIHHNSPLPTSDNNLDISDSSKCNHQNITLIEPLTAKDNKIMSPKVETSPLIDCCEPQMSDLPSAMNNNYLLPEDSSKGVSGDDPDISVMFSEDDEEEGGFLNSQLSYQIDCVQTFLKLDRLKRTRLRKT